MSQTDNFMRLYFSQDKTSRELALVIYPGLSDEIKAEIRSQFLVSEESFLKKDYISCYGCKMRVWDYGSGGGIMRMIDPKEVCDLTRSELPEVGCRHYEKLKQPTFEEIVEQYKREWSKPKESVLWMGIHGAEMINKAVKSECDKHFKKRKIKKRKTKAINGRSKR